MSVQYPPGPYKENGGFVINVKLGIISYTCFKKNGTENWIFSPETSSGNAKVSCQELDSDANGSRVHKYSIELEDTKDALDTWTKGYSYTWVMSDAVADGVIPEALAMPGRAIPAPSPNTLNYEYTIQLDP